MKAKRHMLLLATLAVLAVARTEHVRGPMHTFALESEQDNKCGFLHFSSHIFDRYISNSCAPADFFLLDADDGNG